LLAGRNLSIEMKRLEAGQKELQGMLERKFVGVFGKEPSTESSSRIASNYFKHK
jgi:hypothetical protein